MTHKEKIEILKNTIIFLYEKEGRSINYISKLLEVDRKQLTNKINEWNLKKINIKKLTPSNQKFANKNKQLIKSRLEQKVSVKEISKELNVGYDYLLNIIHSTEVLENTYKLYSQKLKKEAIEKSSRIYNYEEIENEIWKEILGYENYFISNKGRVKKYIKRYNSFCLLKQYPNIQTGRLYVKIKDKNLQVSRLVGFAFVKGYSEENNTIEHKDNNVKNNDADNLEWVSMSINNKKAYKKGRKRILLILNLENLKKS